MNLRITIIDAQDVTAADLETLLPRVTGVRLAALPAAQEASAVLPPKLEPPVADLPDPSIRQMAAMPKGYRPKTPRAPRTRAAAKAESRPVAPARVQCSACSYEPEGPQDRREKCPKCNGRAWEAIPARVNLAEQE
jgi:hypothetical protein